jgi:hypothetical protein
MRQARNAADTLDVEIAHLRGLDLDGLRARRRSVSGRAAPVQLPKHLLYRILAYRLQAAALGDLDRATVRYLYKLAGGGDSHQAMDEPLALPGAGTVKPGALLMREWEGVQHRVMALDRGFAWNGTTYGSFSHVARAITGTRWSGPRFFGVDQRGFRSPFSG